MWQSQEEISRMTKPCRNNSPSYEACYGHWEGCAVWGRVQRAAESLLQDLQRKERDCPFLQVLKMIQGRSLNKGVSSTANRALLFLASEEEGNLGRDTQSFQIHQLPSVWPQTSAAAEGAFLSTHSRTKALPSSHQEYRGQNFRFGNRVFFIVKKFWISLLKPQSNYIIYIRSLKLTFPFPLQILIDSM